MGISTVLRALFFGGATIFLSACEYSPEMTERAMSYNSAVAKSTDQQILLNIVRASEREPRYFTRFGANQAQTSFGGTLTPTFSFDGFKNGSIVPAPTASTGNTVTLDNLDDKKYQVGANAPIDNTTVEQYWNQGLQPDLLGLLFVDSISIPTGELEFIKKTVDDYCGQKPVPQKYCLSLSPISAGDTVNTNLLEQCINKAPISKRDGGDYAIFINDPSWFSSPDAPVQSERCFIVVMRTLLALGLHPVDGPSTKVAAHIADAFLKEPRFREKLIEQSLTITTHKDDESIKPDENYVTKKGGPTTFELDSKLTVGLADKVACTIKGGPMGELAGAFSKDDLDALGYLKTSGPAGACRDSKKKPALGDLKISLHVRSFEAVIYFLGEVVREEAIDSSSSAPPTIVGREPWETPKGSYEEPLFLVRAGQVDAGAPVAIQDDHGNTFWIPDHCLTPALSLERPDWIPKPCSMEYPDHESLTVLTIVDQLWGLQKEPSDKSATPTLSLGK
jgi:hypothetical protein